MKPLSICLLSTDEQSLGRELVSCESGIKRDSLWPARWVPMILFLSAAAILGGGCRQPEAVLWPPNVERTDVRPAKWMVGCFALDPMTDRLRAAGAPEVFELTARRADVVEGKQRYRVALIGSSQKYGAWWPPSPKKIYAQVGSPAVVVFTLAESRDGLVGSYRELSDASPGNSPEIPVSLRRVPCISTPPK
jgi:hypothetical protein